MTPESKVLATFAACTVWLAALPAAWSAEPPAPMAAKVVVLSGDVSVGARALKSGDGLAEAEEIAVGRGSYATLEFTDRSIVRVMSDSRLRIETHRASSAFSSEFETRLQLGAGAIEAKIARRRVSMFSIASLAGSVAASGATFRVRGADDAMLVEVLDGRATVTGTSGGQVAVNAGYGTRVMPMEAPLAPVELLRAPDISRVSALHQRPVVRLLFAPVPGAQRYRIIAAVDRDLRDVLVENTQRRPEVRMVDLRDGEYFYGVRAVNGLGLEGDEARGRFRLKARPLPPSEQTPESDTVLQPGSVTFSWAAAEEAATYRFQLATDESFDAPLVNRGGLMSREFAVDKLPAGTYYWRIASVRASGDPGPFGDPLLLRLQAPAPAPAPQ